MEFSQLVLMLALVFGGGPSGGDSPAQVDSQAAVRPEPRRDRSSDNALHSARPAASEWERLATGLVFGAASSGRAR
jgi:hypothetical protein